jgi:hypothetical protein
MATVELSANELQAIIDGLLFRIGGLSDLSDPSHVKEGRISADDAAGWGEEAKFSRELADRLMELHDQADMPKKDGDLCALLKSSADWLDQLAEGARLTGDKRTWRGEAGRIRIFAHRPQPHMQHVGFRETP